MSGYTIEFMTAVKNGHLQHVQELLDTGVDVDTTNEKGDNGLIVAILGGHLEVIDLLCRNEADVNATNEKGLSPLTAIRSDDHWDIAKLLIETHKADINQKNARDVNILMSAAEKGMKNVVTVLLENGTDVDYATKSGWSALLKATQNGHLDIVNKLLKKKANVNQKTKDNWTALNLACFKSYSSIAETLIRHHADVNNITSKGFSPLMCACNNRDLRVVKLLIDHGADVNKIANDGMTALELAHLAEDEDIEYLLTFDGDNNALLMQTVRDEGKVNIFKMLLDFGIDVNTTSKNKTSVLMAACKAGNLKAVQLLLSRDDIICEVVNNQDWNALMIASYGGHLEIVSELLKKGAEVKKVNKLGNSALLMAAHQGHADIVERLLQSGADVNHMNHHRWTAAMVASQNNHVRILRILLQHGAVVDMVNNGGYSPLMIASEYGFTDVIECLCSINGGENISVNASFLSSKNFHVTPSSQSYINMSNDDGETALTLACRHGHGEIIDLLLIRGANPNHRGSDGLGPLLTAATCGHLAVVKILLQHQADVDSEDDSGDTALIVAAKRNDSNLARLLLEHNANVNHQNKINLTPLHIAWERDHGELWGVLKLYKKKQRKETHISADHAMGGRFHSPDNADGSSDLEKKQFEPIENNSHPSVLPGSYPNSSEAVAYTLEQRLCSDAQPIYRNSNSEKSPRSFSTVGVSPKLTEPVSSTLHNNEDQSGDMNLVKLMGGNELMDAVHPTGFRNTLRTLSATTPGFTNARHQNNLTHKPGDSVLERNQQLKVKSHWDVETKNISNHNVEDTFSIKQEVNDNMSIKQEVSDNVSINQEVRDNVSINQEVNDDLSINQEVKNNVSTQQNKTDVVSVQRDVKHFVSENACKKYASYIKQDDKDIVLIKQDAHDTVSITRDDKNTFFLKRDDNDSVSIRLNDQDVPSIRQDHKDEVFIKQDSSFPPELTRSNDSTRISSSIVSEIERKNAEGNACVDRNLHIEEICNKDSAQQQTVKTKPQNNITKDGFLFQTSLNAQESMSDHQHMQAWVHHLRSFPITHQKDEQEKKNPVFSVHSSRENPRSIHKDRCDETELKGNDKEEDNTEISGNTASYDHKDELEKSSHLESAAVDPREDTSLKLFVDESLESLRSENDLETPHDDYAETRFMCDFNTMSELHSESEPLSSSVLRGTSNHVIDESLALPTGGKSHSCYVPPSPIDTREDFISVHTKETGKRTAPVHPIGKRTQPLASMKSNITIGSVDCLTMGESPVECFQHSKLAHIQGRGNDVTRVNPLPLCAHLMDNKVFLPENTIRGDTGNDQSSQILMDASALTTMETTIPSQKQDEPIPKWVADIISAVSSSSVNAPKPETPLHLNIHYDATVHNVTIPSTQYCAINNSSITASNEPSATTCEIGSETKRDVTSVRGRKEPLPPEEAALILKHYHYLKNELDATTVVEHLCAEGIFDADDKRDVLAPSSAKRKTHVLLQKLLNAGTGDAFDVFTEFVEKVQPHVSDKLKSVSGVSGRTKNQKNCCIQ